MRFLLLCSAVLMFAFSTEGLAAESPAVEGWWSVPQLLPINASKIVLLRVERYRPVEPLVPAIPGFAPPWEAILRAHPEEAWQFTFYYAEVSTDHARFVHLERSSVPARLVGDKLTLFMEVGGEEMYRVSPHAEGIEVRPLDGKDSMLYPFKSWQAEKVLLGKASGEAVERLKRSVMEFFR